MAEFVLIFILMIGTAYGTGAAAQHYFHKEDKKIPRWVTGGLALLGGLVLVAMSGYILWKVNALSSTLTPEQRSLIPLGWMWLSRALAIVSVMLVAVCAARPAVGWWVSAALTVASTLAVVYVVHHQSDTLRDQIVSAGSHTRFHRPVPSRYDLSEHDAEHDAEIVLDVDIRSV